MPEKEIFKEKEISKEEAMLLLNHCSGCCDSPEDCQTCQYRLRYLGPS